jgi:cytochrome oxidase Cu insertion factor (SCO1/SenC/PrrC family)
MALAAVTIISKERQPNIQFRSTGVATVGGPFQLVGTEGQTVTEKDLLGKPSAVFFGFTYCPDVCPTTLFELTTLAKQLGPDADKLNFVFVSVDSERDGPEEMKQYLEAFDDRIIGLTGTAEQIDHAFEVEAPDPSTGWINTDQRSWRNGESIIGRLLQMAKDNAGPSTGVWIVLAMVAGMLAGLGGILVSGGFSDERQKSVAEAAVSDSCSVSPDQLTAIRSASKGAVAAMLTTEKPRSMRGMTFSGPDGSPVSVGDFEGKTLLINLWATWCAPCREEMPALDALQNEVGGEKFEVIAVNLDTGGNDKPLAFLKEIGIDNLRYYSEQTLSLFNGLKKQGLALGLPVTLLVNGEGCLLAHMNGPAEWASEDAVSFIRTAMGAANEET